MLCRGRAAARWLRDVRFGVHHVVGAYDEHDIGSTEVLVDLIEVEQLVVRHVGFSEQHIHVSGQGRPARLG